MTSPKFKLQTWQRAQSVREMEQERINFLRTAPLPKNPPELMAPTKVKVLKSFCIGGRAVEIGVVITLPRFDALSLEATNKIELINGI